ncbi:MAG: T9SS type A sorting domain-containing protein [Marinilabiliales bacterium]|nr:T9SS type A sorting domain-containing protein [Marinilabiliales bacterium]
MTIKLDGAWNGTTNTDWNTVSNWDCGTVPSITSNVLIANGKTNYPTLSAGLVGTANNLTIQNSGSLTVTGNKLQIAGNLNNTGTFTATNGTLEMKGSSAQTIPAATFAGNTIKDLIINNAAGVTLGGSLNISGILTAITGNLASGGNLTLLSTSSQTALIDGTGGGQVTGMVNMQRYLPSGFGYKYFSSPFSDATVGQFSSYLSATATIPAFYKYIENNTNLGNDISGWAPYTSGTLGIMNGYAANLGASSASKTVLLNGTVNNGNYSTTLYNHNGTYTKGFNLVGNPYPSPIDWNASGWTKTNVDNALYFFDSSGGADEYSGTYSSYVGGVSSGGSTNIIPSMQGFFVHVTNGSYPVTATLGMSNSVRTTDLNPTFKEATVDSRTILRFAARFTEKNSLEDNYVIYFDPAATSAFDKEKDALKLMNTDNTVPNLYSISPDFRQLSINGMKEPSDSLTRIPLGVKTLKDGNISIIAKDLTRLSYTQNIYLRDNELNVTQDLRKNSIYTFSLKKGDYNQRFELLFKLSDGNVTVVSDKLFVLTRVNGIEMVKINLPDNLPAKLVVTDIIGRVVLEKEVVDQESVDIGTGRTTGVYLVTVSTDVKQQSEKTLIRRK